VPVEKDYRFDTDEGRASLPDLFKGRSQLLVYHFMFGPDFKAGCPSCSSIADGFNGVAVHLANHDVMLWAISRGPLAKLQAFKKRMGWTFPWASAGGTDFNADYAASFTDQQQREGIEYNFRREAPVKIASGGTVSDHASQAGTDDSYSAYSRGVDGLWGMYQWLDRAPKGRNEEKGVWWRHHDRYPS